MKQQTKGDVVYYTFEHFDATGMVKHGFSTKLGGVSEGHYAAMNLGMSRGDVRERVVKNYELLCSALEIPTEDLVFAAQTHTTNVRPITEADRGNGFCRSNEFSDVDGLLTNRAHTAIVTFYADCVPLFFLDVRNAAIAISHAGWRGTLEKIGEETVRRMAQEYGTRPADLLVGIGPSIGDCCFEVDAPVYTLFEAAPHGRSHVLSQSQNKRRVNLWGVNQEVLTGCGVPPENIEIAQICTKCNSDIFYSHRVMGAQRGSLVGIMELAE